MYDKLLLEKDGGIIDEMAQAAQDNCAVLCIGLGGTGIDCLRWVKKKVYNRLRPDSRTSSVPEYRSIKFLAVDTDKSGIEDDNGKSSEISRVNLDEEFFDLSIQGDVSKLLKGNAVQFEANPNYRDWLRYEKIEVQTAKHGAGGVRMLGRYLLALKAERFVAEVQTRVVSAIAARNAERGGAANVYVHIFTGMGGGTGAGTFLDVCYLTKHALAGKNPQICGYFFLPDVNISKPDIDQETKAYIAVNGYASMQSLDYCMNFEHNGDKWSQRYAGIGLVEFKEPPVDLAHLITAQDIESPYDYAMNVVTEYFMMFVSKVGVQGHTLNSHIANFTQKKTHVRKYYGARYEYLALGASSATLPYKEILTYLAAALFERFRGIEETVPNLKQLKEFIRTQQLEYTSLYAQITQSCDPNRVPTPDYKWRDVYSSGKDVVADYFQRWSSTALGQLETNFSEMSRDLLGYAVVSGGDQQAARSVITKIFNGVSGVITDPAKGPFYAAALVKGVTGNDLVATIDGYIKKVAEDIAHERSTMMRGSGRTLAEELNTSQNRFFEKGSRRNYEEYVDAARLFYGTETRVKVLEKLQVLLRALRKQVEELANKFTTPLRNTVEEIMQTFQKNLTYLNTPQMRAATYEYPLFTVENVRENLETTIREMNRDAQITSFMNRMLSPEGLAAWQGSQDRNKVAMVVTGFFTALFHSYSSRTMTDYLHETYGTDGDTEQLILEIRNKDMNKLNDKAKLMFWQSDAAANESPSKMGYINVPDTCGEVKAAAQKLIGNVNEQTELALREVGIKDRITITRFHVGVPLFCYGGCAQYEISYVGSVSVGRQPYEGKKYTDDNGVTADGRNWLELPSVIPLSVMKGENSREMTDRAEAARELYKRALEANVIQRIGGQAQIVTLAPDFFDELRAVYERAESGAPGEKLAAQARLKDELENRPRYGASLGILGDAADVGAEITENIKEQVRIDHFAAAPELRRVAEAECGRRAQLAGWIAELEPKVDTDLADYAEALFTGVLTFTRPYIKTVDNHGKEKELSNPDMPFGAIPLYQGLRTYKALPESERRKIAEAAVAARRAASTSQEAKNAIAAVKRDLGAQKTYCKTAEKRFTREYGDICAFLDDMGDRLELFATLYDISLD